MKCFALSFVLLCANFALAQSTFVVDDFSDRYFGKIFISDTSSVFSKGWIAIFDKSSKKQLIRVSADELAFDLQEGKIVSNVKELPYGEQSLIMHEDYNFDGRKDLALMDGQNSCYHGPSFRIYLASKTGFAFSPAFTRLAQEYCGMFDADPRVRRIRTMTKSGCCWHQYSDFMVKNDRPVAIKVVEEAVNPNGLMFDVVEETLERGKMRKKRFSVFDAEGQKENTLYSFEFDNRKIMRLIKLDNVLHYVFTDKENKVQLIYSDRFLYSTADRVLSFARGKTTYNITADRIFVTTLKGKIEMKAKDGTVAGSFSELQSSKFENVIYQ